VKKILNGSGDVKSMLLKAKSSATVSLRCWGLSVELGNFV